jgi:hypothetical protein
MRRLVWDFFRQPELYNNENKHFFDTFLDDIDQYRENIVRYNKKHAVVRTVKRTTMPCLVGFDYVDKVVPERQRYYKPARVLSSNIVDGNRRVSVYRWFTGNAGDGSKVDTYMAYRINDVHERSILYWYIVADAMCLGCDAFILQSQRQKWDPGQCRLSYEKELFMCAL